MESRAEMWPGTRDGDHPGGRLLAAFTVSLAGHALMLFLAREWRAESRPSPPLVVSMVEGGRAGDGERAGGAGPPAPAPAMASVPAVPAIAVPVAAKVVPPHEPRRRQGAGPSRSDTVPPVTAPRAATNPALALADSDAGASPAGVPGEVATADDGAGAGGTEPGGGRASGFGGGHGSGSDGLRAFCRSCPTPDYPGRARRQGWQGTVDVELAIGRDGAVQEAHVGRSSGYPALDEVALDVARQSRFAVPAAGDRLRGQLRYRFVLDATAARR